jgi:hypothetical protein
MPLHHPEAATPDEIERLHDTILWATSPSANSSHIDMLDPSSVPAEMRALFPGPTRSSPVTGYVVHATGHYPHLPGCGWMDSETRPCSAVLMVQRRAYQRFGVIARFFIVPTKHPNRHELYRQMQWPVDVGLDPPGDIPHEIQPAGLPSARQARGLPSIVLRNEAAALMDLLVEPDLPRQGPRPES